MKASDLKKECDALLEQGITTKEQYLKAVPMIFELRKAIKGVKDWMTILADRLNQLSEGAAYYAIDHATALDEPLSTLKDGIESGTVEIGGETYRLTLSRDDAERISGGNFTQEFLKKLPKDWVVSKLVLKQSALSDASSEDMAKHDLKRDVKRIWSISEAI